MLDTHQIPYRYREIGHQPLSADELRTLLTRLAMPAAQLLRRREPVFRQLALRGDEDDETLIPLIALHPTLLQRPIGVLADRAVVGRPPERLLELLEGRAEGGSQSR